MHQVHHVGPRHEKTLADHVRLRIHEAIQYLHSQMRHADFVGIRKAEAVMQLYTFPLLDSRIHLTAGISRCLLYFIQYGFNAFRVQIHLNSSSNTYVPVCNSIIEKTYGQLMLKDENG